MNLLDWRAGTTGACSCRDCRVAGRIRLSLVEWVCWAVSLCANTRTHTHTYTQVHVCKRHIHTHTNTQEHTQTQVPVRMQRTPILWLQGNCSAAHSRGKRTAVCLTAGAVMTSRQPVSGTAWTPRPISRERGPSTSWLRRALASDRAGMFDFSFFFFLFVHGLYSDNVRSNEFLLGLWLT